MNIFFSLYLAHLIGDYVLQTSYIAKNKNSSIKVLSFHVFIIYISLVSIIIPDNLTNHLLLIFLAIIHFFIDYLKFKNKDILFFNSSVYYLLDQLSHLSTIVLVSYFFVPQRIIISEKWTVILSLAIFNSFFIGILVSFLFKTIKTYKRDFIGYIIRFSIPLLYNPIIIVFSIPVYSLIIYIVYKKKGMENFYEKLFALYFSYLFSILILMAWRG